MVALKTYIVCNIKKEHDRFLKIFSQVLLRGIDKDSVICMAPNWDDEIPLDIVFKVYDPYLNRGSIPSFTRGLITLKDISLVLNYSSIFQHAAENNSDDSTPILILQSNVILHVNFLPNIKEILEDNSWDYVHLMNSEKGLSRSCGALLFRMKFIRKILKTILPFREPIDAEIHFQALLHKATAITANPPLAYK